MNSTTLILIGVLSGIATAICGIVISYSQKKRFFNEMDVYITNVEHEVLENIRDIGLIALTETPTGRELYSLLSEEEKMMLGEDFKTWATVGNTSELTKNINNTVTELPIPIFLPLALPIPIYGTVEAGLDGELHVDHFNKFTIVNKVELQGQAFDVYGIWGNASINQRITITTTKTYGWLRIHGLSMNGWDLPFDENDYALFYKTSVASHLDYVIASNRDPSGEIALIVKRFDAENNLLLSKSNDISNPYNPIQLDENHQIVGIVIAVAKPAQ
jgi:hypothetical protein